MRLSRSMTLAELLKMGFVEIRISKPGTPLRPGEWRDALPNTQGLVTPGTGLSAENAPDSRRHQ